MARNPLTHLDTLVRYTKSTSISPVTPQHVDTGMTTTTPKAIGDGYRQLVPSSPH